MHLLIFSSFFYGSTDDKLFRVQSKCFPYSRSENIKNIGLHITSWTAQVCQYGWFKSTIFNRPVILKINTQQNFIHLSPHNSDILTIWRLRTVILNTFYHTEKLNQWNRKMSGTCSKRPPTVYVLSWYLLIPFHIPSTTSAMKTPENAKTLITLNQKKDKIPNWNTTVISCKAQI